MEVGGSIMRRDTCSEKAETGPKVQWRMQCILGAIISTDSQLTPQSGTLSLTQEVRFLTLVSWYEKQLKKDKVVTRVK